MTNLPTGHSLYSQANHRRFEHWVWQPSGHSGPLPLLVLLHGVNDAGGFVWWQRGQVHTLAQRLWQDPGSHPMIILMPSDTGAGHGSGYTNWNDGFTRAETYLVEELLPWTALNLPVAGVTALAGLSMGGYAALMLALRHRNTFSSASSMSGFFQPRQLFQFIPAEPERIWADEAEEAQHNVEELILQADRAEPLEVFFDCGRGDPLIEDNRRFHQLLVETGVPHQYAEHQGGHDWDYWRQHLDDHLRFHAQAAANRVRHASPEMGRSTSPTACRW